MLDLLISGKTRIKLLTKFFLVPEVTGHLRGLADEFNESTNAIRLELNRFEQGGLLVAGMQQNRKVYRANRNHPLFADLTVILRKHVGIDQLIEHLLERVGNVTEAWITGDMARGRDTDTIQLILIGHDINRENLDRLATKAEQMVRRRIQVTLLTPAELTDTPSQLPSNAWKIWGK